MYNVQEIKIKHVNIYNPSKKLSKVSGFDI